MCQECKSNDKLKRKSAAKKKIDNRAGKELRLSFCTRLNSNTSIQHLY